MNYLAHCFLSCTNEDVLVGNFITDFLKPKDFHAYSGEVLEGIQLHRVIDQFTDSHPASLELRRLLRKRHKKYAPVVVDLVWDHYLSVNWSSFSGSPLSSFASQTYDILLDHRATLPIRLNLRLDEMINNDFLLAYATKGRMERSLAWMDRRAKFKSNFTDAIIDVEEQHELIQDLFHEFFPDLIRHVEDSCDCL